MHGKRCRPGSSAGASSESCGVGCAGRANAIRKSRGHPRAWRVRVQRNSVRRGHSQSTVSPSHPCARVERNERRSRLRTCVPAEECERARWRGLPAAQRVDAGPQWRSTSADHGLRPRRRIQHGLRLEPAVRRHASVRARRCRGRDREPSAERCSVTFTSRACAGADYAASGNVGSARSRAGAAHGCAITRESFGGDPQRSHGVRSVGRRREDRDADGDAGGARPVPSRRDDERAADHGGGAAQFDVACAVRSWRRWGSRRRTSPRLDRVSARRTWSTRVAAADPTLVGSLVVLRAGARPGDAAAPSVLSGCAAAVGADPDDHRQHARRDARVPRRRTRHRISSTWKRAAANACCRALHVDIDPELRDRRVPAPVSALLADRGVLRRDDGGSLVAWRRSSKRNCAPRRVRRCTSISSTIARRSRTAATARCTRMDIPLVFDNIAQPGSLTGMTPAAQRTAEQMSDAFIAFARSRRSQPRRRMPAWRPYDARAPHRRCCSTREPRARRRSARRGATPVRAGAVHPARHLLKLRGGSSDESDALARMSARSWCWR